MCVPYNFNKPPGVDISKSGDLKSVSSHMRVCDNLPVRQSGSSSDRVFVGGGVDPPLEFNVVDLCIEGFASTYKKSARGGHKSVENFSHGWLQPSGVWHTHRQGCSNDIINSAFSSVFPLSKKELSHPKFLVLFFFQLENKNLFTR